MQNQSIITAALSTYRSKLTRYVLTKNQIDLDQAKSAVRWIKAEMELNGKQYLTPHNGLLNGKFKADINVCRQNNVDPFIIDIQQVAP
ncbi:hypothetical protein ACRZ5S_22650 (plasmid) [Vibrio scophthalmi]|uniref:hypothetical protein n=1 Tax=Vibrio scophthalmi TaxID=45658 RepID=UPI003EC09EE1